MIIKVFVIFLRLRISNARMSQKKNNKAHQNRKLAEVRARTSEQTAHHRIQMENPIIRAETMRKRDPIIGGARHCNTRTASTSANDKSQHVAY